MDIKLAPVDQLISELMDRDNFVGFVVKVADGLPLDGTAISPTAFEFFASNGVAREDISPMLQAVLYSWNGGSSN